MISKQKLKILLEQEHTKLEQKCIIMVFQWALEHMPEKEMIIQAQVLIMKLMNSFTYNLQNFLWRLDRKSVHQINSRHPEVTTQTLNKLREVPLFTRLRAVMMKKAKKIIQGQDSIVTNTEP